MNKTLSPQQIRLVAVLGLLAACVLAWWMLVARKPTESSSSSVPVPAHTTPAKPVHPPKPAPKASAKPSFLATHGLPVKVAKALDKNPVVVVALYTPGAVIDKLARAESQAGAGSTGAGFVTLNVLRQKDGGPLLNKIGVVDSPAVLVVRRPGTIFAQLEGYVDRATVEQAVANARR